jgi:hypothetical protein
VKVSRRHASMASSALSQDFVRYGSHDGSFPNMA